MKIPFNKPFIVGKELEYIEQSVRSGHTSGDGMFTKKCHKKLEEILGSGNVFLTTSCTSALEMSSLLCDINPGDEVILPSFTFVSTANAFYLRGAKLVFVDIRPDTLNINEKLIAEAVTDKTKLIVPVHYAGVACEMDTIMDIASTHGIKVVEDAAQALGATYKGRMLGTIGHISAFSFHETKNYICGEGGAIVINDESLLERAEIVREKGTNRNKFFRGEVDKYTWVDVGSSYLPSDILAAFLYAQLEEMDKINKQRESIFARYYDGLKPLANLGLIELPTVLKECGCNNHMFYINLKDEPTMHALSDYLKERGVMAVFHYQPLHLSEVGKGMGYTEGQFPVTESISGRLLRLPFFYELTDGEQEEVIRLVKDFFKL